ncbi:hypothetical protein U9M48_014146 [Paspalum notatum var. saurae]|uniref:Protein kinase domain-containing protein n=1 Tax=Paspalum notatum var. saurae TaxID=547442 RepID=A0AAQ3T3M9_PASNO
MVHRMAEQPHHDHSSSSEPSAGAGDPSWLPPPMDICSGHFGKANTTDSSVLLLLLVSVPSQGDHQPVHRRYGRGRCSNGNKKATNLTAPWTSLPLEPGFYGTPQVREEPVCSNNPFGLNISLDVGLFSLSDRSALPMPIPPMTIDIDDRQISDHPASGAPSLFGFVLCRSDGNGSFIPTTILQDGTRYTRDTSSRYRDSEEVAQPRKLLGAHQSSTNLQDCHRQHGKKHVVTTTGIASAVALALLALVCPAAGLLLCWRRRIQSEQDSKAIQSSAELLCPWAPRRYSHGELAAATCGFSDEEKIGRGGFGPVYRGYLRDQDRHVAIKVLHQDQSSSSSQERGTREFQAEVKVMTRLRHRNIVQLLGWCDAPGVAGLMLVYEFVPNGSLDRHLYDHQRPLPWSDRYKIALGVGSALLYLHTECEQCILHGDIKPANILLDPSCNAKLGDFGLARVVDHGADPRTTQVVAGTPGYMDPEFVISQRPGVECDVYSFGVVLLEIACGRRPTTRNADGKQLLLNWIRDMYRQNSILGVVDGRLEGEFDHEQMRCVLVAGLWCAHHDQSQRPSIGGAMDFLRSQDAELPVVLDQRMWSPDAAGALEEILASCDLPAEDSALENCSTTETVYHSTKDSTGRLEC